MENIDLDLNNYSKKDLERFFKLKNNYNKYQVEENEYNIRTTLLQSGLVDKKMKGGLIAFLEKGKQYLLSSLKQNEEHRSLLTTNYNPEEVKNIEAQDLDMINREPTQFIYTQNSDVFPGKLNPLDNRVITKCLNIDTRFRSSLVNTQSSDFTFQLSSKLSKVVSMELSNIEMPLTFYGISAANGNNYLYICVNYINTEGEPLVAEKIFIVPDGNYTPLQLIDKLNELFSPRKDNNDLVLPNEIFSYVRFNVDLKVDGSGSGKVTIGIHEKCLFSINNITLDFTRNITGDIDMITHITQRIGYNLGFIKPTYNGCFFYESESIINTNIQRYVYLSIDDFNKNTNSQFISIFNESVLNNDILARISIEGSHFNEIQKNKMTFLPVPRIYFGPVDIQRIRVRLFDEYGKILNTNYTNFSFCLTLKMLYDL
jgi:hypothetical protein